MSSPKEATRRVISFVLSFLMAISAFSPQSLAYAQEQLTREDVEVGEVAADDQEGAVDAQANAQEQVEGEQAPPAGNAAETNDAQQQATADQNANQTTMPAFSDSVELKDEGVVVYADADEGTFPAGVRLDVRKVQLSDEQAVAVDNASDAEAAVKVRYSFDVKVLDADGNEIQPAQGKKVDVRFAMAAADNEKYDSTIYHVKGDAQAPQVDKLETAEVRVDGQDAVEAKTDGFSMYVVEFTQGTSSYTIKAGYNVAVTVLLDQLGINYAEKTVKDVTAPDNVPFSAAKVDGVWSVITSSSPREATGNLTITFNDDSTASVSVKVKPASVAFNPATPTYTGEAQTITVKANDKETNKVQWRKNDATGEVVSELKNAGTYVAEVQVTDTGELYTTGNPAPNQYPSLTINPADLSTATVTLTPASAVAGNTGDYRPAVSVKLGNKVLDSADYTVSYPEVTGAGDYKVTVFASSNGNLAGSKEVDFKVNAAVASLGEGTSKKYYSSFEEAANARTSDDDVITLEGKAGAYTLKAREGGASESLKVKFNGQPSDSLVVKAPAEGSKAVKSTTTSTFTMFELVDATAGVTIGSETQRFATVGDAVAAARSSSVTTITLYGKLGLTGLATYVNAGNTGEGYTFELSGDVTFEGNETWTPIGAGGRSGGKLTADAKPFKGTFDGQGNTVSGLSMDLAAGDSDDARDAVSAGLFGVVEGGTVTNLRLASVSVESAGNNTGAAVGLMHGGTVQNVMVYDGGVTSYEAAGGIVGRMFGAGNVVIKCSNAAAVTANGKVAGGIVGSAYRYEDGASDLQVTNCINTGAVTSANDVAGGIVGFSWGEVTGNTNSGAVQSAKQAAGGIVGEQRHGGTVSQNVNSGTATGTVAGGIVGQADYAAPDGTTAADIEIKDNDTSEKGANAWILGSVAPGGDKTAKLSGNVATVGTLDELTSAEADKLSANKTVDIIKLENDIADAYQLNVTDAGSEILELNLNDHTANITAPSGYAVVKTDPVAPSTITKYEAKKVIATIGETNYYTFEDAVTAALKSESEATIVLAADEVVVPNMITLNKNVTIDLNGKKLTGAHEQNVVSTQKVFEVVEGAKLTINGAEKTGEGAHGVGTFNGRINVGRATNNNGSLVLNGGTYACGSGQTVVHVNGECRNSNVTISNASVTSPDDNGIQLNGAGTFSIQNSSISGKTAVYQKAGELTIANSTLTSTATSHTDYSYNGNGSNATGDAIVVDTCLYPGGAPKTTIGQSVTLTVQNGSNNKQVGYYEYGTDTEGFAPATIKSQSKSITLPDGKSWLNTATAGEYQVGVAVARIGEDKNFGTLQEAINAAVNEEIDLLGDITESVTVPADKTITLDLNGKTITPSGTDAITNKGTLTVKDSSDPSKGKIVATRTNNQDIRAIVNEVNATLTIQSGSFVKECSSDELGYVVLNKGTATISGGTFTSGSAKSALVSNGWYVPPAEPANATLNINGGTFTGGNYNVKNDDYGTLTINDGTFNGGSVVNVLNVNNMTVNGGTFNNAGTRGIFGDYRSGGQTNNSATMTVNGGTFNYEPGKAYFNWAAPGKAMVVEGGVWSDQQLNSQNGVVETKDKALEPSSTYQGKFELRNSLKAYDVTAAEKTYNGQSQAAELNFKHTSDKSATDVDASNYTVTYYKGEVKDTNKLTEAPTDAGTYNIVLTGAESSDYAGTESNAIPYVIKPAAITEITATSDKTYNGKEQEPTVAVKAGELQVPAMFNDAANYGVVYAVAEVEHNNAKLEEGKPFNAGTYTVNLDTDTFTKIYDTDEQLIGYATKDGNFYLPAEGINAASFTIASKSISGANVKVAQINDEAFTGEAIEAPVLITDEDIVTSQEGTEPVTYKALELGTDFTIDYSSNTNVGTAMANITGIGNYTGTRSTSFSILPGSVSVNKARVELSQTSYNYDGTAKEPAVTVFVDDDDNPETAEKQIDPKYYSVTYYNNVDVGEAMAFVVGEWSFIGGQVKTFTIKKATPIVTASIEDWTYGEDAKAPSATAKIDVAGQQEPQQLADAQFTYEYKAKDADDSNYTTEAPAEAGEYTMRATLVEANNYESASGTKDFTIAKSEITPTVTVAMDGWTYGETAKDPVATAKLGDKDIEGATFTYTYKKGEETLAARPADAGTYTVTASLTGTGSYQTTTSEPVGFTIAKATPIVDISIKGWEYGKFNAQENTPTATVSPDDLGVTTAFTYHKKGEATEITADAIKTAPAGEYTVTAAIEATDNYDEAEATADFVIAKQRVEIPTAAQSPIPYDGKVHAVLTVPENAQFKVLGDNTVTDAGDYMVFATLKDSASFVWADFTTDVKPYELTITPKTLTDAMVANIVPGFEAEPAVSVTDGDKVLVKGTDYDVTYNGNTATVTGKGNYTGIVEKSFTVGTAVARIGEKLYSTLTEAVNAAQTGDTIQLVDDIALTSTVETSGKNFTLDLNGHNIAATDARALWVKSGDVTITGEGTISATATDGSGFADSSSVIRVGDTATSDAAKLTVGKDVTVTTDHCYGITVFGKNTEANELVLNGKVAVTGDASAISGNGSAGNAPAHITVNEGAEVSAKSDAGIYFPSAGTLDINGGTITGPTAVYAKAGNINVNGGTLAGTGAKADYKFNGDGLNATGDALVADNCNYPEGTNGPTVTLGNVTLTSEHGNEVGSYNGNGQEELSNVTSTTTDPITIRDDQTWVADGANYKLVEAVIVTFKDGDTTIDTKKIEEDTAVAKPADPTKDGYVFTGWFAENATAAFDFDTEIATDTTLTAQWSTEIAIPTAAQNLTYTGAEQTGVAAPAQDAGYTLSGDAKATNAGTYTAIATLADGYCWADGTTEPKTINWSIAPVDLSTTYIEPIANQTYGAENWNQPAVTVKDATGKVITNDVQVAYANNSGVGLATVKVTPKQNDNNYTGQATTQFAINPADSAGVAITAIDPQTYTGSEIKPTVVVKKGETVIPNDNYDLTYINNVEPGTATVIATLKGNYSGSATTTFQITGNDKTALTQSVQNAANAQNNTPISTDGSGLPTGMHYVTPEQANALQNAINNANSVLSDPKATANDIAAAKQALDNALNTYNTQKNNQVASNKKATIPRATTPTYNGSSQTGVPAGEGYTMSGNTGTNAGSYTATATLKSGYVWSDGTTGAKKIPWKIAAAPANRINIAPIGNQPLTDGAIRPAVRVTDSATGKALVAGKDYDVTYSNNNGPGTATATVTGKGNYAGSKSQNYTIYAPHVSYRTHVQRVGWQQYVSDGDMSGTTGKSYRLEGINIKLSDLPYSGGIQYRTHVQRIGWQDWKHDDQMAGTQGKSYRLEAIEIKLTGEMANHYDVYYRVHCQRFGWMGWAKNGERSGSAGYSRRLEGIQIVLVRKGDAAPGATYKGITQKVSRCFAQK